MSVQVIVADADAHASLLHAVFAQRGAAQHPFFAKSSVTIVHEEETGSGVTGDVDVRPSVFVKIGGNGRHTVGGGGTRDAGFLAYIGESSVAVVAIERIPAGGQAQGPAFGGNSLHPTVPA